MTPTTVSESPAEESKMPQWDMTEDIVISGISGRFPESDSVDELAENLLNNVDMITEDERRWPIGLYGLPGRAGKIKDLSKFDAQFFGVHGKQANLMDPQARMLLELTYEAICDAGTSFRPFNLSLVFRFSFKKIFQCYLTCFRLSVAISFHLSFS